MQRAAGFALLYFLIAWAFHAGTINPSTQLSGGGDAFIQGLPSKLFSTSFSPWNSSVQAGKYVYADVLYQSFYPPNLIIFSLLPNTLGFNFYLLVHYALAGVFMCLYLGSLRLTTYSAFIGGLVFMVCGFMCAHKGHEYILCSAIWLPLVLFFVDRCVERLQILSIAWAAVPLSLSILAGFPQITLYCSALILAYLTIRIVHSTKLKGWNAKLRYVICTASILFFLAGLLGCLPIFAVAETLPYLTRERLTYEMFISDSFPPWQLLTFLIPNLFGGVDRHVPMYGPATTVFAAEVYPYVGLLPLAFAIGCFIVRLSIGLQAKFWLGVAVVGLLLSFGGMTPIYRLLFHIPIYNLFRVPARHLFEVDLALSVLAALGLDYFLRRSNPVSELAREAETFAEPKHEDADPERIEQLPEAGELARCPWYVRTTLIIVSLIFVSSLLLAQLFRSSVAGNLSDSYLASHRMYDNPSTAPLFSPISRPELDFLKSKNFDESHYRIFPVDFDLGSTARLTSTYHLLKTYPYPLLNMFAGLSAINDYGPFWLKRYQAVTGFGAGGTMPAQNLQNHKILSVLGTRFLLALSPESKRLIEAAKTESGSEGMVAAYSLARTTPNGITIYENSQALPRFRFVKRIIAARDLEDALFIMRNRGFDPANEAIVENLESEQKLAIGKIVAEQIENTRLNLDIETEGRSFLIVADSFFPGWTASVDGKATPILPAYGCVRGILIETAGKHHVEFWFCPKTLFAGLVSTSLGILSLVVLCFAERTGWLARFPYSSNSDVRRFHR